MYLSDRIPQYTWKSDNVSVPTASWTTHTGCWKLWQDKQWSDSAALIHNSVSTYEQIMSQLGILYGGKGNDKI